MCYIHPHTTTVKTYWFNSIESSKSTRCQNSKWLEEQLSLQLSFYFKTIIMLFLCLILCVTLSLTLFCHFRKPQYISFYVWDGVEIGYPCLLSVYKKPCQLKCVDTFVYKNKVSIYCKRELFCLPMWFIFSGYK